MSILIQEESIGYIPVRYWRGQSNIEWPIDSAGYRRIKNIDTHLGTDYNKHLISYEENLLEQATHKGYRYQNGRELYDFELLGRLQHHGAATRLVDFSKNVLIALFFCVNANPELTGLLFGLHTSYIHGQESIVLRSSYGDIINECESDDAPTTWEPPSVSSRIAAQHSQFLYSKVSKEKTGSLLLPKEKEARLFIAINPIMKAECKSILVGLFDFRTITLFPDIDGFGLSNTEHISRWDMDRW